MSPSCYNSQATFLKNIKHFEEISEGKWEKNGIYCKKRTIKEDIQGCFLSLSIKTK